MHSRHGVSVLRTLFEPALLELQRGPIELVDQLGMPLPQPFLGQELSGQTLEPCVEPAVVGIHAATPLLPPPRPRGVGSCDASCCAQPILRAPLSRNTRRYPPPLMRHRSPVKWVERSKTKNEGRRTARANGAMPPSAPRRYAAQRSNAREVSRCMSPVRIPGRLTSGGLVRSARIAIPIHFA